MGLQGFIFFAVFAAIYNFFANKIGGIVIKLKDLD